MNQIEYVVINEGHLVEQDIAQFINCKPYISKVLITYFSVSLFFTVLYYVN